MAGHSRRQLTGIFTLFAAGYFLSYSFRSIGPLIAPDLMRDIALDANRLGLLASVYFLTFAIAQPVIGIAMDRHGPARVNAMLFAIAAAGAALFAWSESLAGLAIGRGLIGFGVAGALMTSFKAFVIWYEPRHREVLTGAMMAVGGVAAMMVSIPAELLMRVVGWRGMFWLLGGASILAAAALWWRVPAMHGAENGSHSASSTADSDDYRADGLGANTTIGYRDIVTSRIFLSYLPLALFGSGGFSAIQSLWAGPWLIEVAGHTRAAAAQVLFVYGFALLLGYFGIGMLGARISSSAAAPRRWYISSLAAAFAALAAIISNVWPESRAPWFVYGLTLGASMLAYPALTKAFPAAIAGRVVTAYNFVMFTGAFALQWGMGALIQALLDGGAAKQFAYQCAFTAVLAAQVLSLIWFWVISRSEK